MKRLFVLLLCASLGLHAASYITTSDNEDNFGTGNPDNDMGAGDCVFNTDSIHPVEFNIDMTGALPQTSAYLDVFIEDIDWPDEVDEVRLNGHVLGYAVGEDDLDNSTLFIIPDLSWVREGNNLVEIYVDLNNTGEWCAKTVSGELVVDEGYGPGPATVTSLSTDASAYDFGDTVSYTTEIDTTDGAQQHVRVEISLRDANGTIVNFDDNSALRDVLLNGTEADPYTATFTLPASGEEGLWSILVAVYDLDSLKLNEFKTVTFTVPKNANVAPALTGATPSPAVAGEAIVISGNNFVPGDTQCTVGGVAITNLTVSDTTTITGNLDAATPTGTQDLVCSTSNGSASLAIQVASGTNTAVSVPLSPLGKAIVFFGFALFGVVFRRRG